MSVEAKVFIMALVCFAFATVFTVALWRALSSGVAVFRSSRDTRANEPIGYWFIVSIITLFAGASTFGGGFCLYAIFIAD